MLYRYRHNDDVRSCKWNMLCMLFSEIYYICRVAHGHRQVGRLALRTSDTCAVYTHICIYTHPDNVRSCKWNMLCLLFSDIYYICRVAHGHRQVGRLALRTSDTCAVYTHICIYTHPDNVRSCKWNMLCLLFSDIYYICRVAHGHWQVGRLALRTSDTCAVYTHICIYTHTDNGRPCEWNMLRMLFSDVVYICRVAHGHWQVGRLAFTTSDTCYKYIYIDILIMWDHINEICYVCCFLIYTIYVE